jgi:fused signal recognition particle receptor
LANLIKIIIITTIKIKIYEYREQFDNIKIKIPNAEDFVHKCYINAASFSWKNAYLYNRNNIKDAEYQNNLNIIEENIRAIVKKTFRDFIPFDEIFKQIEDNLSDNVHQYKDTDAKSVDVEITKKKKKHPTDIKADEVEDEEESEADEAEDDEEADEAEDDEEADEAEESDEEESDAEESEADEADEADDDEAEDDDEESEADEADEADDADDKETDKEDNKVEAVEAVEAEATKETKKQEDNVRIKKTDNDTDDNNKINNIVDIKYSDDKTVEAVEAVEARETFASQEISFATVEAPETDETSLPSSIHKEWNTIKDEYSSLSQNKMAYKAFDKKKYALAGLSDLSGDYDDDAISVASHTSGISNITDISHIKQIHITDTNKSKKPTFF